MTRFTKRVVAVVAVLTVPLWALPVVAWGLFVEAVKTFEEIFLKDEDDQHGR